MTAVFQVKTACTPLSLHAGAAQLLLNSLRCSPPPRLILVIPEKPDSAMEGKLKNLNIETLTYTWNNDQGQFAGLQALLEKD